MGSPFVDGIVADRGNDIIFAVDVSASMQFSSRNRSKISLVADVVSAVARLAEINGDRVGLVAFSDAIEKFLAPRIASKIFRYAIARLACGDRRLQTNVLGALRFLSGTIKKQSVIVLCCDTFGLSIGRKSILAQLRMLKLKHEVILITATDDNDMPPAGIGKITTEDAETGDIFDIDTDDSVAMEKVRSKYSAYENLIDGDLSKLGINNFRINSKDSAESALFALLA
jgi:uncharacterized protein (DUF58 family)